MEEREEKGECWKTLEKDMEKYEIESCEYLAQLEQQNLLNKAHGWNEKKVRVGRTARQLKTSGKKQQM